MFYFAYGSNLHPERLRQRVPSREFLGLATLAGYRLTFTKRGGDGSGKCAVLQGEPDELVHGVVYRMAASDRAALDAAEDVHGGGYRPVDVEVVLTRTGASVGAFTYVPPLRAIDPQLHPFDWYKAFVVSGARYHGLPEPWQAQLDAVPAIADADRERAQLNAHILAALD